MLRGEKTYEHESYGMIGAFKTSGGSRSLFGSHTGDHHSTIRLVIKRGERNHHLGRDWYSANRPQLIEVEMSPAQWILLITDMNTGDGHPCTLLRVNGETMEDPPRVHNEPEAIMDAFNSGTQTFAESVESKVNEIHGLLEKKTLLVRDKAVIKDLLRKISVEIKSDRPFAVSSFMEAAERSLTAAKIEAESYMALLLNRAGLKALNDPRVVKMLTDGDEK